MIRHSFLCMDNCSIYKVPLLYLCVSRQLLCEGSIGLDSQLSVEDVILGDGEVAQLVKEQSW